MFLLHGTRINLDQQMTIGDVQYPPGHFRDADARAAAGIVEVPDQARPDERYYFVTENGDGILVITPKPIESVLAMVWEWIMAHRDTLQEAGCQVGASWYHNDLKSRTQWERMVNRANSAGMADTDPYLIGGQQVAWKTMSGDFVPLTAGVVRAVVAAFEVQEALIFTIAETHKATLGQLADVADVAAYDWRADWPAVYIPAP